MIEFKHVVKSYGDKVILHDLNFTIEDGQFVCLIGKSGCGKTTTLKSINQLIPIDSGKILIDGNDVSQANKAELRRHIGYVIQQIGLFPNMTVAENIQVVPRLLKYDDQQCQEITDRMLGLVHMESYADAYPSELSGGQQQRIGVLRALAANPPIVLMDEPFGALDPLTRDDLQDEIKNIQQQLNKTIVFVTHDMNEALKLADVIIFMDQGQIVQMGTPEEFLRNPANDLVREFLGKHIVDQTTPTKVEDFMRTNPITVKRTRGIHECAELMARRSIDSLIVVDNQKHYIGTVTVADIMHYGRTVQTIEPLIQNTARTVQIGEDAKDSFEYLLSTNADYVIVLHPDQTIAGIITKTSVAQSVAKNLWGEEE
ncbi:ABC transporter ATP-binding protein [Catenisphaera adipataccumulans]|uniref:Quaternary amine transport ATP-binding protein n=1 Tax=Catenisphaera adipataccumulans TaxID=700500 RepID=A0A7W8FXN1_9FIRM|nr:ABC transporter ATP-binding protein [Catenisphaera adipataccumulans]MBB5183127.1 osmoprotectant transport system ATP-binding protein [Catenisphaera adipataccumulans]